MRTRLGLKVLGLSALVMGVMAIGTAGVAQAETGACWKYLISGVQKCFGEGGLEAGVKFAFENNTGTLLIENVNFEVLCTAGALVNGGKLTSNGSVTAGVVKFTGCIGLQRTPELKKLASCTPFDETTGEVGVILTLPATGLIKLHEGEPTVLFKPVAADEVLAHIHLGELCGIGEELLVKGELVIRDCGGKTGFEEHKLTHLAEEYSKLQLMKVGVNKATIDGSANFTLLSPHNELLWGGKPA